MPALAQHVCEVFPICFYSEDSLPNKWPKWSFHLLKSIYDGTGRPNVLFLEQFQKMCEVCLLLNEIPPLTQALVDGVNLSVLICFVLNTIFLVLK